MAVVLKPSPATDAGSGARQAAPAAWLAALLLLGTLLGMAGYRSRDPDSALHAAIVAHSYQRPIAEWIAPGWGGQWGRADLYREHPPGILILPSVVALAGYPPEQAAYAVNALFQVLTVLVIARFAALLVPAEARTLSWLLLFLPIAFTYRIRANHEQLVLLLTLVALYATERARHAGWWSGAVVAAVSLTFLVKGVFALPLLVTCAVWQLLRPTLDRRRAAIWGGLLLAAAGVVVTATAYEMAYRQVTAGDTFLGYYLPQQLGLASVSIGPFASQKAANLAWYLGRLLWFAAPWSVLLLVELASAARSQRWPVAAARELCKNPELRHILLPVLAAALVWPFMFSFSDRRADRYIFPAYYLVGAAGAVIGIRRFVHVRRATALVERACPFEQVVVWVALVLLSLAAALVNLPRIRL